MTPPTEPTWCHALVAAVVVGVCLLVLALHMRTCGMSSAEVERQWEQSIRQATGEDGGER